MESLRRSFDRLRAGTARFELRTLLVLVLMAGLGWGFIHIATEVMAGSTHAMDESILMSMRNEADLSDPVGPGWVEEMGRDFTALGGVAVLGLLTLMSTLYLFLIG